MSLLRSFIWWGKIPYKDFAPTDLYCLLVYIFYKHFASTKLSLLDSFALLSRFFYKTFSVCSLIFSKSSFISTTNF